MTSNGHQSKSDQAGTPRLDDASSGSVSQNTNEAANSLGAEPTKSLALHLETFTLGPFGTNCYLVRSSDDNSCWLVDASYDSEQIVEHLRNEHLTPAALVLTHAHCDHIAGVNAIRSAFPTIPIYLHAAERDWLNDPILNLSAMMGMPVTAPEATTHLEDGQNLSLCDQNWTVIHTPGHSPGGIVLYNPANGVAISGDALFAGSVGRTDFPGSSHEQLVRSIRERLYTLPPQTKLYPGHGPPTTIARERMSNPFVRG